MFLSHNFVTTLSRGAPVVVVDSPIGAGRWGQSRAAPREAWVPRLRRRHRRRRRVAVDVAADASCEGDVDRRAGPSPR